MLQPGDVVVMSFRQDDGAVQRRPGLVVEVSLDEEGGAHVRVAFGTSQGIDQCRPWEFAVRPEDGSAFTATGLNVATRFRFDKFVELPAAACRSIGVISHAIGPRLLRAAKAAKEFGYL